jgi:hypothetical protein
MGGQIILTTDPFGNANPFGNEEVYEFCINATQWMGQQQAFREVALQLGMICLIIGFMIGVFAGYYLCRNRYGNE